MIIKRVTFFLIALLYALPILALATEETLVTATKEKASEEAFSEKTVAEKQSSEDPIAASPSQTVATRTVQKSLKSGQQVPDQSQYLAQVIFGLLLVIGLIFALAWMFRRIGHPGMMANSHMKIIASLSLSARERVVLVDVGGEQILLGVAPGNITSLHSFPQPVITEDDVATSDFSKKLKELLAVKRQD